MYTIESSIEISASVAILQAALSTREGFRAWLAEDTRVDSGRYTFTFAFPQETRAVTFTLDRADEHGVAMTCVDVKNNPDWLGTELTIKLTRGAGGKTRVALAHARYRSRNECYERSAEGWAYFLSSLAQYATTGKGTPFPTKAAAPAAIAEVRS